LITSEKNIFHFLPEISKGDNYRLLFPELKAGMAIIWLFEKIENGQFAGGFFKEADIHEAFQKINVSDGQIGSRYPREYYNALIADLQEYFLRFDDEQQQYSFKEYAYKFCRYARETLQSFFDPTQIEKICYNLRQKLSNANTEEKLFEWFETEFITFKPQLKSQLDYLDKQIDQSVLALRENKKMNLQQGLIIETLKQIDEKFEQIRTQNKELRTAFGEIEQIRKLIDSYTAQFDNDKIYEYAHHAISFFQEMRQVLSLIDKRLDRIQPRIKQLFSNLNKPLFNTRVEKFISFLVQNSKVITENNKKILLLPGGLSQLCVQHEELNFIIVERKPNLFPAKAVNRLVVPQNQQLKEKAFAVTMRQVLQQDFIMQWVELIENDVRKSGKVTLSSYFFQILKEDSGALNLAVAVAYKALKYFESTGNYSVNINPEQVAKAENIKTTLWEMTVQRK